MSEKVLSYTTKKPKNPFNTLDEAEELAIRSQESLKLLGYEKEMLPLRLPNRRGTLGLIFACLTSIVYGISGYVNGYGNISTIETSDFILSALDGLTIMSIIGGVLSIILIVLGFLKRHAVKKTSIAALIVLVTAPVVLHILGTALGILLS